MLFLVTDCRGSQLAMVSLSQGWNRISTVNLYVILMVYNRIATHVACAVYTYLRLIWLCQMEGL